MQHRGGVPHAGRAPQPDGAVRRRRWSGKVTAGSPSMTRRRGCRTCSDYLCCVFSIEGRRRARGLALRRRCVRLRAAARSTRSRLAVLAARALKRSVRVVAARASRCSPRLPARHDPARCASAPTSDGTLDAVIHEAIADDLAVRGYFEPVTSSWSGLLYKCDQRSLSPSSSSQLDLPTPSDMRAPGGATGRLYGLECAMDELAVEARHRSGRAAPAATMSERGPERRTSRSRARSCATATAQGAEAFGWDEAQSAAALDARGQRRSSAGAWRPASGRRCRCKTAARIALTAERTR